MNASSYSDASGDQPAVSLEIANGLATITLDSASTRNTIGGRLKDDLAAVLEQLTNTHDVRVAVIRANGPMFCPGADIDWLSPHTEGADARVEQVLLALNPLFVKLRASPIIILTAVHGAVAGGGLGLLNVADLVIAANNTRFNTAYTRIGAIPDLGATWWLPRLVGERKALELLLLCDGFDANDAKLMGLVNFVVPAEQFNDEVDRLAKRLAAGPRHAFGMVKRLVNQSRDTRLAEQLEMERKALVEATSGAEFAEGVAAFLEKRAAHF